MTARLIAIDWGTTAFRAAIADGRGNTLERHETKDGILAATGRFAAVLAAVVGPWRRAHGTLPILMSGMIGSRQGWREAPYVHAPARLDALASGLLAFEAEGVGRVAIVPGVDVRVAGAAPDVMRGEETQIFGALAGLGIDSGTFVQPGTHAKWVRVEKGAIVGFETFMTGEVYAALSEHTILGRMMEKGAGSEQGFRRGLDASAFEAGTGPGALLNRIFSTRTLGLFNELTPAEAGDYLSGLLIGAEMREGLRRGARDIVIFGSRDLEKRYRLAADHLGITSRSAATDAAVPGLVAIAKAAGLIGNEP